jgi:hypothetical protein
MYSPLSKNVLVLFFLIVLFKLGDIGTTAAVISLTDISAEINPLLYWLMKTEGVTFALVLSFIYTCNMTLLSIYIFREDYRCCLTLLYMLVGLHILLCTINTVSIGALL